MLRALPVIVEVALLVFCLIDCIQSDEGRIRNLPKTVWILLIIFLPIAGGIAWLAVGRPLGAPARNVPWPSTKTAGFPEYERPRRAVAPDDDPEFLAGLARSNTEHEKLLRDWEEQLRDRERRLREREAGSDDEQPPAPGPA
jgi:hypothetical protein